MKVLSSFKAANGNEKLWKVFWGGLFYPIAAFFLIGLLGGIFHKTSAVQQALHAEWFFALNILYVVAWSFLVWKCRRNSKNEAWKYLALFFSIVSFLCSSAPLINAINPRPLTSYSPSCLSSLEEFAQQNNLDATKYLEANRAYLQKCTKEVYKTSCEKTMTEFAKGNGLDPQDYIKKNQTYLNKCAQALEDDHSK